MVIQDAYSIYGPGTTLESLLAHFHQFSKSPSLGQYQFIVADSFCREDDVEIIKGVVISKWFNELLNHVCKVSMALRLDGPDLRYDRNWELHWADEPPTIHVKEHTLVTKYSEEDGPDFGPDRQRCHTDRAWMRVRCQASVLCRPIPEVMSKLDKRSQRVQGILAGYLDKRDIPLRYEQEVSNKKPDIMSAIRAFG